MSSSKEPNANYIDFKPFHPQQPDKQSHHKPWVQKSRRQHKNLPTNPPPLQSQQQGHEIQPPNPAPPALSARDQESDLQVQNSHHGQHPPHHQGQHAPLGLKLHHSGKQNKSHSPPVQPLGQHSKPQQALRVPPPRQTKPHTWLAAALCVVFWLTVILGGLAVLIVYLVFRPSDPRFDISSVTLKAAYLDMGYLLNADVSILANFTNPNEKVSVDFRHLILGLYYGDTLIAITYIKPFAATRRQSKIVEVHLVSSQVRLPLKDSQHLKRQIAGNGVTFQVRGWFRARSHLGTYLPYSYALYGHCNIALTGPPSGVLTSSKCTTKR